MVPELPPAPAALVDEGLAFFTVSLWSAAARRRMAERGPPGGEDARRSDEVDLPVAGVADVVSWSEVTGEEASACWVMRVSWERGVGV